MVNLRRVRTWFEAISGLKVNTAKISLIPVGEVENIQLSTGVLARSIDSFPITYLVGARFKEKVICCCLVLVGLLPNLMVLMGIASGGIFQKDGRDSLLSFPLR